MAAFAINLILWKKIVILAVWDDVSMGLAAAYDCYPMERGLLK